MSDCACRGDQEQKNADELLEVFLEDDDQPPLNFGENSEIDVDDIPGFTVFNEEHMKTAHDNAYQLSKIDADKMKTTLKFMKNLYPESPYVDYLSRVACFKHPDTRNSPQPPTYQVLPTRFFRKDQLKESLLGLNPLSETVPEENILASPMTLEPEYKLNWWRNDPGLNEHHCNWHVYCPFVGDENGKLKDREGELFAYMHEQMLARYNFERLAVGLSPVIPFGPGIGWDDPLLEGFNPKIKRCSVRPANMNVPNFVQIGSRKIITSAMESQRERLQSAIGRGYFEDGDGNKVELTMDKLGCAVESSIGSPNSKLYGNVHNDGHVVIAKMTDPDGRYDIYQGPMIETYTACRDPAFFRWHKFVDSIFEEYRTSKKDPPQYKAHDLKMDGIDLVSVTVTATPQPAEKLDVKVNELYTRMVNQLYWVFNFHYKGIVDDHKHRGHSVYMDVLDHVPFKYEFSVKNRSDKAARVVFRVFLAPAIHSEEMESRRNDFVELDCFVADIKASEDPENPEPQPIKRLSKDSSVLMSLLRPIVPDESKNLTIKGTNDDKSNYCGCGWPRNLLIPRGTVGGMEADLFVLATNWEEDAVDPNAPLDLPGNVAYCGKQQSMYPDKRPMGFPFDRAMHKHFKTIQKMVDLVPNSTATKIKIKFMEDNE